MPARQSAGSMLRSVSYAVNIQCEWGNTAVHSTGQQSDHVRTRHLTTLIALGVPLASDSSHYHTINTSILRAFTSQTRMREQHQFCSDSALHLCWHSLTILTLVIPRPRQAEPADEVQLTPMVTASVVVYHGIWCIWYGFFSPHEPTVRRKQLP